MTSALMQQLDIFQHSPDAMLRNDLLATIEARQAGAARASLVRLESLDPEDRLLPSFELLVQALENPPDHLDAHEALGDAMEHVEMLLQPAVARLMPPSRAALWIEQEWRALAQAAADLAYAPRQAYAAPCWLWARAWQDAEKAVLAIPSWRRMASPLAWMAEARLGSAGFAASWPLLAELAWLDPSHFEVLARRLEDADMRRLLRDFDSNFENDPDSDAAQDLAWFPAWCLLVEPGLAVLLRESEPGSGRDPERTARLLMDLYSLERQGSHAAMLEQRRKLRRLHASIFARYLQTR